MCNFLQEVNRPVTSLGHQVGRRVFWERPNFFTMANTFFQGGGEQSFRGVWPPRFWPWRSKWPKSVSHVESTKYWKSIAHRISLSVSGSRLKAVFGYPYPVENMLSCRISNRQIRQWSSSTGIYYKNFANLFCRKKWKNNIFLHRELLQRKNVEKHQ